MAGPLFGGSTKSGVAVSELSALGNSAIWCGVRTISQDVGCLVPGVYDENEQGIRTRDKKHKLNKLFREPNPEMTGLTFRETIQANAILWGNGYAEIIRDGAGNPVQLWPIHPQNVMVYRDSETGQLLYKVTVAATGGPPGSIGQQIDLQPQNILHIPGLSPDGSVGYRLLTIARETIGFAQASMNYGAAMFRNGVRPSGTLETTAKLDEDARKNLKDSYRQENAGADNVGTIMLLEEGLTWKQASYTNEQAQYIEILDRFVFEVARLLVIPPPKLMSLEQATWANITELNRAYGNDCLRPWFCKWEAEYERKLLLPSERENKYIEVDCSSLLRADEKTRYQNYDLALAHQPWRTVDEVRAAENLPPLPKPIVQAVKNDPQNAKNAPGTDKAEGSAE